MTCIVPGCKTELWRATRRETEDAAIAACWRFRGDGKAPELSAGAALCSEHANQENEFRPAKARKP